MQPKRVLLYLITSPELGGAQSHVLDLITSFHRCYEVHLAVGADGPLADATRALGVPLHLLPSLKRNIDPLTDCRAVCACTALVRKIRPDLIHAHSSKAGLVGRLAGRNTHLPVIYTAHGWAFSPGYSQVRRHVALMSERVTARLTKTLICVSEDARQLALRYHVGDDRSVLTIPHGCRSAPFPTADPTMEPPRLIMVARFTEPKDQQTLLQAFAKVQPMDAYLDLVGIGRSMEACRTLADSLGIAGRVRFLGARKDVADLLARSQVFVLSTRAEGLPISILEAMRAGLPIVASRVGGIPEEVVQGETGLLVAHSDVEALADALRAMICSPELRLRLGQAGLRKFRQEFTIERMVAEVEAVYKAALPDPPTPFPTPPFRVG